ESFQMYDPLAKVLPVYGWVYPFIETALGLMFLMRFEIPIALMVTLVILGVTTVGVTKVLLDKKSIQCACLGTALKLPMTKATFIENSIMIAMAIAMLTKLYS
ncbi:MAG: heavy metal transporter, partial [Mangrovimonas sp.]|nr:heavy metal transporter [Mangrovimonas sp.]